MQWYDYAAIAFALLVALWGWAWCERAHRRTQRAIAELWKLVEAQAGVVAAIGGEACDPIDDFGPETN